MERFNRYDRATVGLWRRASLELAPPSGQGCLAWAAVHAVLAGLRRHRDGPALLAAFDWSTAADADFALIRSLLSDAGSNPLFFQLREAAHYLRWRELGGD